VNKSERIERSYKTKDIKFSTFTYARLASCRTTSSYRGGGCSGTRVLSELTLRRRSFRSASRRASSLFSSFRVACFKVLVRDAELADEDSA
jgi:hypothetical protein